MAIDLKNLSPAELNALIGRATEQLAATRAERLEKLRADIVARIGKEGFELADVFPRGTSSRTKSAPKAKYRDPSNPARTWSGFGRRPQWMLDAQAAGIPESRLLVQSAGPVKSAKVATKAGKKAAAKKAKSAKRA